MLAASKLPSQMMWFQSSSGQKAGCNNPYGATSPGRGLVSILIRPEGRMQRQGAVHSLSLVRVSILIRPEGRMQLGTGPQHRERLDVSILIRPEGRMQLEAVGVSASCPAVSILIRPEGRMQRFWRARCNAS